MNWLDILVLVYIGLGTLRGYSQGLIKSFFNMAGFLIAAFIARMYYSVVASILTASFIGEKLNLSIDSRVAKVIRGGLDSGQVVEGEVEGMVELFKLPSFLRETIVNKIMESSALNTAVDNVIQSITSSLTELCINLISFLILFIAIKIAISILVIVLDLIAKLPVLHQLNKGGGLICGFLAALLTVMVIFALITPFASLNTQGIWSKAIEGSSIAKEIYYNNFILKWTGRLLAGLIHQQALIVKIIN